MVIEAKFYKNDRVSAAFENIAQTILDIGQKIGPHRRRNKALQPWLVSIARKVVKVTRPLSLSLSITPTSFLPLFLMPLRDRDCLGTGE